MAAKDEEDGNVNADDNLAETRVMEELWEEIANALLHSQVDIASLPVHEVARNVGEKKEITGTSGSCSRGVDRSISSDHHQVVVGSKTSNEQGGTSTNQPSSSDIANVETKSAFEKRIDLIKENAAKAPIKNDRPFLPDDIDVTFTASSPGRSPSVSMTKALLTSTDFVPKRKQQAMNLPQTPRNLPQTQRNLPQTQRNPQAMNPHYPQLQVPSGQYGNVTRPPPYFPPSALPLQQHGGSNMAHHGTMVPSPYWRPEQNDIHNMPAFVAPYGTMVPSPPYWLPPPNDIYNMPQFDASMVPYGVTIVPYPYGFDNRFGTWIDNNPANSRFGYEAGASSNQLPSMQHHQGGDLNAWRPNEQNRQIWDDTSAAVDQQIARSDPSDQTQQRSPPRDN